MNELTLSLLVIAGLHVVNALVSALLWRHHGTVLYRALFLLWVTSGVGLVAQGLVQSKPGMVFAFALPAAVFNLCLADLMCRALGLRVRWRLYAPFIVVGATLTLAFYAAELPFWAYSSPIALAIVVPLIDVTAKSIGLGWRGLSISARCTVVAVILAILHELDYPFLRDDPQLALVGFYITILVTFALSITAPAIILERTSAQVRKLEADVIQAERLAALGEAAAVVAHEVRNPLATINNAVELLRREPELSPRGREMLSIQQSEVMRLDRLVTDLLCFSKPLHPARAVVELTSLLRHAIHSVESHAERARVRLELTSDGEHVTRGDADHLMMAFTNVLQNAIEASPPGAAVRAAVTRSAGETCIAVEDGGEGIDAGSINRLFEPFFTTRATGSGLGLAIVHRILDAHGGHARVRNLPGKGARFELVLPRDAKLSA